MQTLTIRRRANGTIDTDGYRREALMLRTQARTGALKELARRVPWRYAGVAAVIATCLGLMPHLWASGVPAADGHAVVAAAAQAGVSAAAK